MKQGFTLIELLVVVLIIGILSAVALPQYQKSVTKARFSEAQSNISTIKKGVEECLMATGSGWGSDCTLDKLTIQIGAAVKGNANVFETNNFMYEVYGDAAGGYIITSSYNKDKACLCYTSASNSFSVAKESNIFCGINKTSDLNYAKLLNLPENDSCTCC